MGRSKNEMNQMYADVFRARGLVPCDPIVGLNPAGMCFEVLPEVGSGYCWMYQLNDNVSISIIDQTYNEDCLSEIVQPDYLTIGYYESVSGEVLTPYRRMVSGTIHAHIGTRGTYRFIHHAGFPVKGISITMMPEYYEEQLKAKYGISYVNPRDVFSAVDGLSDFPKLISCFFQVRDYIGDGMAAAMFYESKVEEILSLIMERSTQESTSKAPGRAVPKATVDAMLSVASYIDEHYSEEITLDFLTKIACMSKAKLMQDFKSIYNCSINHYQQKKRISHAQHLLKNTEMTIGEVSYLVGYRNQGSFSEVFKKHTGVTPKEYKKM